ncbi:hypothetical protein CIP107575_00767 [Corynebacterium diphtheriae]|nr:hypothetical protein CIP107575_00767 [Corynebacterium diphtheriae]
MNQEHHIRMQARHLKLLLLEVDAIKTHMRVQTFDPRYGSAHGCGLPAPGNLPAISLHAHITKELTRWEATLGIDPRIADDPCERIALSAYYVAEHPDAELFLQDLTQWVRQAEKLVGRGPTLLDLANRPERRQSAKSIIYKLAQRRIHVTRQHLHTWGARGHISVTHDGAQPRYLLSEVIAWATRDRD